MLATAAERCVSFVVGRRSRVSGEGGPGEGVWSGWTLRGEPADDGKRCVQPLDVACILFVMERRTRYIGEGGSEGGVWSGGTLHLTGSAVDGRWTLRILCF